MQAMAAKLFSIKLCYLATVTWHLYRLLIDERKDVLANASQVPLACLFA